MSRRTCHPIGEGAKGRSSGLALAWSALVGFGLAVGCDEESGELSRVDVDDGPGDAAMATDAAVERMDTQSVDMAVLCDDMDMGLMAQPCYSGPAATAGIGICNAGTPTCMDGAPGACVGEVLPLEVDSCDGRDEDCDGEFDEDEQTVSCYAGPPGTEGVGICRAGTRTCTDGVLGDCVGEVLPEALDLCDGRDENCDGQVDEDELQVDCYTGPEDTEGVGICRGGMRRCVDAVLGACEGEVLPEAVDRCDGRDEDCDGLDDEDELQVDCYTGPEGTRDVGICRGGTRSCVDGALGGCEGEVLPAADEACDGRDDDCDGAVDRGPNGEPVCGALVARYCRFWLGWTSQDGFDPVDDRQGPYASVFDQWGECPLRDEQQAGTIRCTSSRGDGAFRALEFPEGLIVAGDDTLGIRFSCDFVGAPAQLLPLLGDVRERCHVSLGTAAFDQGPPDGSPSWGVCAAVDDRGMSDDTHLHCNSSRSGGSWAPVRVGRPLGASTDVGLAFRCSDNDLGRSVQRQTALWLGWAPWSAEGPPNERWGPCPDAENPGGDGPRCVSTRGDGLYHRLDIGASTGPGGMRHAGWLGVAITPAPPDDR